MEARVRFQSLKVARERAEYYCLKINKVLQTDCMFFGIVRISKIYVICLFSLKLPEVVAPVVVGEAQLESVFR